MAGNADITIEGNLVANPELRFLQDGTAVANFTVASTPRYRDNATGQWKDGEATFMRCSAWRQLAENVVESLSKGSRVLVNGKLKQRHWETPEGEKRSTWELQVSAIGPSLRFATATITKVQRATATASTEDPWNAAEPATDEPAAFAA
jgi:single-strand DNA-binding protein